MDDRNFQRQRLNLERLERKRALFNRRFDEAHARMNARFDQKEAELGSKGAMKQEQIVRAALELLNEEGLNNLSLREIAKRINMQAPALYWYFKSKEDLVDFMAEAILDKQFNAITVRQHDESWQSWLIERATELRSAMLSYTDGARVVAGAHMYPAITLVKFLEAALASLESSGISPKKAQLIIQTIIHYTFGHVIEEQAAPTVEQMENVDITLLFKPFPHVANVMEDVSFSKEDADRDFLDGLLFILKGHES